MREKHGETTPDKPESRSWVWFLVVCSFMITTGLVTG